MSLSQKLEEPLGLMELKLIVRKLLFQKEQMLDYLRIRFWGEVWAPQVWLCILEQCKDMASWWRIRQGIEKDEGNGVLGREETFLS